MRYYVLARDSGHRSLQTWITTISKRLRDPSATREVVLYQCVSNRLMALSIQRQLQTRYWEPAHEVDNSVYHQGYFALRSTNADRNLRRDQSECTFMASFRTLGRYSLLHNSRVLAASGTCARHPPHQVLVRRPPMGSGACISVVDGSVTYISFLIK